MRARRCCAVRRLATPTPLALRSVVLGPNASGLSLEGQSETAFHHYFVIVVAEVRHSADALRQACATQLAPARPLQRSVMTAAWHSQRQQPRLRGAEAAQASSTTAGSLASDNAWSLLLPFVGAGAANEDEVHAVVGWAGRHLQENRFGVHAGGAGDGLVAGEGWIVHHVLLHLGQVVPAPWASRAVALYKVNADRQHQHSLCRSHHLSLVHDFEAGLRVAFVAALLAEHVQFAAFPVFLRVQQVPAAKGAPCCVQNGAEVAPAPAAAPHQLGQNHMCAAMSGRCYGIR